MWIVPVLIAMVFLVIFLRMAFQLCRCTYYLRRLEKLEERKRLPPTLSAHIIHLHKLRALREQWEKEFK